MGEVGTVCVASVASVWVRLGVGEGVGEVGTGRGCG